MSMEYDSTEYLIERGKIKGKTWAMYKNTNKGKKSIEFSSPLYQNMHTNF